MKKENRKALRNIHFLIHFFLYLYFLLVLHVWWKIYLRKKETLPEAPSAVFVLHSSHTAESSMEAEPQLTLPFTGLPNLLCVNHGCYQSRLQALWLLELADSIYILTKSNLSRKINSLNLVFFLKISLRPHCAVVFLCCSK